jgi:hypothetical protein
MHRPYRSPRTIGLGVILVVASACGSPSTSTPTNTATFPPRITLPGESIGGASNRILSNCYAKYGITSVNSGGGVLSDINMGTAPGRSVQDIVDECNGVLNSSGLNNFAPLTDQELRNRYQLEVAWHDCIVAQGYAIGPIVSEEQFVAAAGSLQWWNDNNATYGIGTDAQEKLDEACPQPK